MAFLVIKRCAISLLRTPTRIHSSHSKASTLAQRLFQLAILHRQSMSYKCSPYIYDSSILKWRNVKPLELLGELEHRQSLKIVSWNVNYSSSYPMSRIAALLDHLQKNFSGIERHLVIFLQEVCHASLSQIAKTEWVSENFAILGVPPPAIPPDGIGKRSRYFNLVLTPRELKIKSSWRLHLPSETGRHALFLDIPINSIRDECVQLCTTHLESLESGATVRKKQLQLISRHLKSRKKDYVVACGVIGGNFNSIRDHEDLQPNELGLKDAWTECPELSSNA